MYVKFFRVRKGFAGFTVFILCLKLCQKSVTYIIDCSFIKILLINRLLTSTFVLLVNEMMFSRSIGLIIQCLITCLMN